MLALVEDDGGAGGAGADPRCAENIVIIDRALEPGIERASRIQQRLLRLLNNYQLSSHQSSYHFSMFFKLTKLERQTTLKQNHSYRKRHNGK